MGPADHADDIGIGPVPPLLTATPRQITGPAHVRALTHAATVLQTDPAAGTDAALLPVATGPVLGPSAHLQIVHPATDAGTEHTPAPAAALPHAGAIIGAGLAHDPPATGELLAGLWGSTGADSHPHLGGLTESTGADQDL